MLNNSSVNKSTNKSRSKRAGLIFPAGRIHRILKHGNYAPRIGGSASIYLAAVLEYISSEILELSGSACMKNNRNRILPRHIMLAIRNDDELDHLLHDVTISQGGVIPFIRPQLMSKQNTFKQTPGNISSQEY